MDPELSEIGGALRDAVTLFFVPLQTSRQIDEAAFRALHGEGLRLVRACKGREDVPKALLKELLVAYSILRNEAPYFGDKTSILEDMANKLESCFRLIISDEVPEDRQPGVPRII